MEKFLAVLTLIGFIVLVFSTWSFIMVYKHIKQFKNNFHFSSALTDQKYFELKAKQEFIIAASAIVFALITFLGISSYNDIKTELSQQFKEQKESIKILSKIAMDDYLGLQEIGSTYKDSVFNTLRLVGKLNKRMNELMSKDVLNQNIFIIDPLRIGDFPEEKTIGENEGYHVVKFSSLRTITGQKLPVFKVPPSVICFANSIGSVKIKEISADGFIVQLESYLPTTKDPKGDNVTFTAWISQKPEGRSFDEGFSSEFK